MSDNSSALEGTQEIITAKATKKKSSGSAPQSVGSLESGAIGVTDKEPTKRTTVTKISKKATVALHSTKNVVWEGVGKIEKGYNIVTTEAAEKWLTRSHVREASPEEIAREYGQ